MWGNAEFQVLVLQASAVFQRAAGRLQQVVDIKEWLRDNLRIEQRKDRTDALTISGDGPVPGIASFMAGCSSRIDF